MNIHDLYQQAKSSPVEFQNYTGISKPEFDSLLKYFSLPIPQSCSDEERLFAILHAKQLVVKDPNSSGKKIGTILGYCKPNEKKYGNQFVQRGDVALKSAQQKFKEASSLSLNAQQPTMMMVSPNQNEIAQTNSMMTRHNYNLTPTYFPNFVHGTNINAQDGSGQTLLHQMSRNGNLKMVQLLVQCGANVLIADNDGNNAITMACNARHDKIRQFLDMTIQPPKPNRSPSCYFENKTMALHRHKSNFIFPEFIIEHAQRRVDLYFYMLIAYYNTGLTVQTRKTDGQHGQGNWVCVKIKLGNPNWDDQRKVIERKEILLIKKELTVSVGFCDKNNQYIEKTLNPDHMPFKDIIKLVHSYDQGYPCDKAIIIKDVEHRKIVKKFLDLKEVRSLNRSKPETNACHSAILHSVWDTQHEEPSHSINTRHNVGIHSYQTSILDNTHFQESLSSTVELHQSVNYFDTHQLERSQANDGMRKRSLAILNEVSQAIIDPLQGMIKFLKALKLTFQRAETVYFQNPEMPSSPVYSRQQIFDCQKKGSFYSTWHENSSNNDERLNDDYVHMILQLKEEEINRLQKQSNETGCNSKEIYEQAYVAIKKQIGLPDRFGFFNQNHYTEELAKCNEQNNLSTIPA